MASVTVRELKTCLSDTLSRVCFQQESVIVTRNGKPAAVLVNADWFDRVKVLMQRDTEAAQATGGKA